MVAGRHRWVLQHVYADGAPAGKGVGQQRTEAAQAAARLNWGVAAGSAEGGRRTLWDGNTREGGTSDAGQRCTKAAHHKPRSPHRYAAAAADRAQRATPTHSSSGATSEWSVATMPPAPAPPDRRRRRTPAYSPNRGSLTDRSRCLRVPPAGPGRGQEGREGREVGSEPSR